MADPGNGRTMEVRMALVEQKIGEVERELCGLGGKIDGMSKLLTGLLVSVATAAVLLAINLVVSGVGR